MEPLTIESLARAIHAIEGEVIALVFKRPTEKGRLLSDPRILHFDDMCDKNKLFRLEVAKRLFERIMR